jgi:hypothetical protein
VWQATKLHYTGPTTGAMVAIEAIPSPFVWSVSFANIDQLDLDETLRDGTHRHPDLW